MSDKKTTFPDINELGSMAGKLFKDIKSSVSEIICTYKQKRDQASTSEPESTCAKKTSKATECAVPKADTDATKKDDKL